MSRVHELKTWPVPFAAVVSGKKKHEIRVGDRVFAEGDTLRLVEWDPSPISPRLRNAPKGYTGQEIYALVTYVTPGGQWGLPENLCVMSIDIDITLNARSAK